MRVAAHAPMWHRKRPPQRSRRTTRPCSREPSGDHATCCTASAAACSAAARLTAQAPPFPTLATERTVATLVRGEAVSVCDPRDDIEGTWRMHALFGVPVALRKYADGSDSKIWSAARPSIAKWAAADFSVCSISTPAHTESGEMKVDDALRRQFPGHLN